MKVFPNMGLLGIDEHEMHKQSGWADDVSSLGEQRNMAISWKKKEVSFSFVRQTRSETLHILYYTGADQKNWVHVIHKKLSATLVTWKFYPEIRHLLRNMIGLSLKPRYFSLSSISRHFRTANPRQHLGLKNCFILLSLVQWFPLFELDYLTVLHTGER